MCFGKMDLAEKGRTDQRKATQKAGDQVEVTAHVEDKARPMAVTVGMEKMEPSLKG